MENQTKLYPSYMGEFYAANPVKFEKRKNNVKPMLYYGLAVVAVIIVIFPGFIPVAGWLVRTVGVIAVLICLLAAYLSNFDYYNSESGGKIKEVGLKKFKRDETDINRILEAFLRKDFEYLAELPGAYSAPVQIHVEEDKLGQEMYCLLTSYDSDSNIIGLTNVLTLSGNDYLDHADVIRQMLKDDAKSLYLIELNRDQNHAKLCQYSVETGELIGTLFEETHPKYVEPQHPIVFLPWDNSKFIYQSQRDGFNHLYLYGTDGKLVKQLTSGNWLVQDVLGFNSGKKEIIIASTEYSPLQSNLFKVSIATGKRSPLGTPEGIHHGTLSANGSYLIDTYSSPEAPRSINLIATQNGKSINLLTAEDPFKDFTMPSIEVGTIKAADGVTDLYYRLIKPADFDPNKKYPTIVYVYGGPHAQMVTGGWQNGARGWDIYMANKGYIMFSLDNRGSDNRGLEFENATFRHLGIEEGKDQVKGVEFLKSLPYVDGNRIGVHGWSFGGHMTTALLLRYPEIFKVGVAGGPVIDWGYYEIMYGERYMDTPQSNPEGYKECNLKNLAGNLKGHLLLIHDDHDDTCVPQHTLSFIKACVDARTYPDLFIYPTHKHNVKGRDRVHLHEKITRYFEEYLGNK